MKAQSWIFASVLATTSISAAPRYEAGTYQLDPAHSKVGFEIPHLVISTVEGRFTKFEGTVDLAESLEKSSVKANIDVASIDTGNDKRDDHLRSSDFLDAKKFPAMKFESTSVKGTAESFKVNGNLTLHGVTKPVTLDAQYLGAVDDGFGNLKVAVNAKTKINRKDFGLMWNNAVEAGPIVGDEVTIDLRIEAGKPLPKKKVN